MRNSRAICSIRCGATGAGGSGGSGDATMPPEFQQVSDGRIRVAIWPPPDCAAWIAAAASAPTCAALLAVRTHAETPRANPSVSAVSGASSGR